MNITISISKTTAFFYWLQIVSGWDETAAVDIETLEYYRSFIPQGDSISKDTLRKVKGLLCGCSNSRKLLGDIYVGDMSSSEAQELQSYSSCLQSYFDILWTEQSSTLEKWSMLLKGYDFTRFDESFAKITQFLKSSFSPESEQTVYLLPSAPGKNTIGYRVSDGDFILVRPPIHYDPNQLNNIVGVIVHEVIHAIEFNSVITRELMRQAYDIYIQPYNIPAPTGYTWKIMFLEMIVYCFANNITGGYLRPYIFGKAKPTMDEFEQSANRFFERNGLKVGYVLAWVGLRILPLVDELISRGESVDQEVFDMAGIEFHKKYLTKKNT